MKLAVAWHVMKIYEARFGHRAKHMQPVQRKVKFFCQIFLSNTNFMEYFGR